MFKFKQLAAAAALLAGLGSAWAAPVVSVVGGGSFLAGQAVMVDVVVDGLPVGGIVSAYDLDLAFDAALLDFGSANLSSALGDPALGEVIQDGALAAPGLVDLWAVSLLSDAELAALQLGGPVTLAQIEFTALADGDASGLAFTNWGPFNDVKGANNEIIIGQVPEPASLALVGIALAGIAGSAAQRRRAAQAV